MKSIRDIYKIGTGPSSSHTMGPARAAVLFRDEHPEADSFRAVLYGSLSKTGRGHGTDRALVAGLLGFSADDVRLRTSFALAKEQGLAIEFHRSDEEVDHPNTVRIAMTGASGRQMEVLGVSLGGGKIEIREINGSEVALNGEEHTLITVHKDQPGIIAQATTVLAIGHINVSNMRVFRSAKNETAVMIVCTDSPVPNEIVHMIQNITAIESVVTLLPL